MNMPSVLTQKSYAGLVINIQQSYTKVAKDSTRSRQQMKYVEKNWRVRMMWII